MGAYHLVRALQALNAQQAYARFGWRTLGGSPPHVDAGMPTCGHTQEARALRPSWVLHAAAMCTDRRAAMITDRRAAMSTYVCQGAETCSRGHATQKVPGNKRCNESHEHSCPRCTRLTHILKHATTRLQDMG